MNPNHRRVTEGLHVLTGVLAPYVARELRAKLADEWWPRGVFDVLYESQRRDLPAGGEDDALIARLDPARCLLLMDLHWNDLFRRKLSREHRTWIKELMATRNKWAHAGLVDMADEDAWRALDTMTRLVEQMDAEATERLRALARTVRYGTEGPSTSAGLAGSAGSADSTAAGSGDSAGLVGSAGPAGSTAAGSADSASSAGLANSTGPADSASSVGSVDPTAPTAPTAPTTPTAPAFPAPSEGLADPTDAAGAVAASSRRPDAASSSRPDDVSSRRRPDAASSRHPGVATRRGRPPAGVLAAVPRQGLRPWREVAIPHPDVAAGRYRQAEFAADLSQVARGRAEAEYQDPIEFFARTYLTEGMRGLMVQALRRIGGRGGEPVIQLKTAFGGGKTHSLLALYHLLRGRAPLASLRGAPELLAEAGIGLGQPPETLPAARVAVVVGTAVNPTRERRPPNLPGITIRTLWGEIAAQLAEQAGDPALYDRVRAADRRGVPPGSDALRELFDACGPCLLLIDELVAYARKIHGVPGLPAGSFDAVQTFIQELTEAVRASRDSVLVATIPESDIEIGGEAGRETLARIEHTFGRMEAIWKPVGSEEGFEVVRRRLFLPIADAEPARDDTCRAFGALYRENLGDFPPECREARYAERLKACYPIHPEVFERLYNDWATLERFQRTRGVLRLMAAVIHDLWSRNDASLLILPGSVGLDAPAVRDELTRYLPEGWTPVLEGDVDGRNSGPFRIDAESPRFGQTVAARRVARAIFLGSAPHVVQQQVRGVEDVRIRLGAVQPGEQMAVFNDALSQLSDRLTYLYRQDRRYWYDTRPNLRRTVSERAQQLAEDEVEREIERRLREATRRGDRGGFRGVHPCPAASSDVPDEAAVRLVLLAPSAAHADGDTGSAALTVARDLLADRGSSPRRRQNMLAFLAPDREAMEGLAQEARRFLAWKSVVRDREALNLDTHQRREAAGGEKASDGTVRLRLNETWRWLLVPVQHVLPDGVGGLVWEAMPLAGSADALAVRAWERMRSSEHVIPEWSPALLAMEMERWFWRGRPHVPVKQVWDAMCAYCYLPRLRDESVFTASIRAGVASGDSFGYAASVSAQGRYEGLIFGVPVDAAAGVYVDAESVLVRPETARAQLEAERRRSAARSAAAGMEAGAGAATLAGTPAGGAEGESGQPPRANGAGSGVGTGSGIGTGAGAGLDTGVAEPRPPRRFFGTVRLDPDRAGRDMGTVAEEVLQHLTTLPGAEVEVSVEISAKVPDGVSRTVRRIVEENCRTLRFRSHGFEEE